MNTTTTTTTVPLGGQNAERELRTKIEEYLHRVNIVEDSKTLALLRSRSRCSMKLEQQQRTRSSSTIRRCTAYFRACRRRLNSCNETILDLNRRVTRRFCESSSNL
jgi:ABC-type ATPase with predicted acetyltransferase domain